MPLVDFPINPILKCWAKNKLKEYFLFLDKHNGCMSFESGFSEFLTTKMKFLIILIIII